MLHSSESNVPVFLVFFNRPEPLKHVFEAVKQARPSKLYLCQDGARIGRKDDIENIEKCRSVVENIDWDCTVVKDYSDENLGCGMRIFSGVSNAFENEDRLIILEDDTVPNQSFFKFCEEILEKYKDDDRMKIISGMNQLGVYDGTDNDYFFSTSGSIWGWATWKRAWDLVEYNMPFLNEEKTMKAFKYSIHDKRKAKILLNTGAKFKSILDNGGKLTSWSYQHGMAGLLNNQLNIVPKCNLTSNIGLTDDSTHAVNDIKKVPKRLQIVFNAPTYDLKFPLKHPKYVFNDVKFERLVNIRMGNTAGGLLFGRLEGVVRQIIFGNKGDLKSILKKIFKKIGLRK